MASKKGSSSKKGKPSKSTNANNLRVLSSQPWIIANTTVDQDKVLCLFVNENDEEFENYGQVVSLSLIEGLEKEKSKKKMNGVAVKTTNGTEYLKYEMLEVSLEEDENWDVPKGLAETTLEDFSDFITAIITEKREKEEAASNVSKVMNSFSPKKNNSVPKSPMPTPELSSQNLFDTERSEDEASDASPKKDNRKRKADVLPEGSPAPKSRKVTLNPLREHEDDADVKIHFSDESSQTEATENDDSTKDQLRAKKQKKTKKAKDGSKNKNEAIKLQFKVDSVKDNLLFKGDTVPVALEGLELMPSLLREVDLDFVKELERNFVDNSAQIGTSSLIINLSIPSRSSSVNAAELKNASALRKYEAVVVDGAHRITALKNLAMQYPKNPNFKVRHCVVYCNLTTEQMWYLGNSANASARLTRSEDDSDLFFFVRFVMLEKALKEDLKHVSLGDKNLRKAFWSEDRNDRAIILERAASLSRTKPICENIVSLSMCNLSTAKKIYVMLCLPSRKASVADKHNVAQLPVEFSDLSERHKMILAVARQKTKSFSEEMPKKLTIPAFKLTSFNGCFVLGVEDRELLVNLVYSNHISQSDFVSFQTAFTLTAAVYDTCANTRPTKFASALCSTLSCIVQLITYCSERKISAFQVSRNKEFQEEIIKTAKFVLSKTAAVTSESNILLNQKFDGNFYYLLKADYLVSLKQWIEKLNISKPLLIHADIPYNLTNADWDQETFGKTAFTNLMEQLKEIYETSPNFCFILSGNHVQLAHFISLVALSQTPFSETVSFTWLKKGKEFSFAGSHFNWVKEDYVFAFAPSQSLYSGWNLGYFSTNSLRYNVQEFQIPSQKFKFQGEVLNTTEKPISLYEHFILGFSFPGSIVVDLGSGSGTFLSAALRCSRSCVAFERDNKQLAGSAARFSSTLQVLKQASPEERVAYLSATAQERTEMYTVWSERVVPILDAAPPSFSQPAPKECPCCGEGATEELGAVEFTCTVCAAACHKGCLVEQKCPPCSAK